MFNIFKNKIKLKNDQSIMSSVNNKNGVKLDREIVVPENFKCLIFYKNKYYLTLSSGSYKLNNELFSKLANKQNKNKSKLKRIKFVAHFISTKKHCIDIKYKKLNLSVEFDIENHLSFAEYILLYSYKTDDNYTLCCITDLFCELMHYNKEISNISPNALIKYGINNIKITTKNSSKKSILSNPLNITNNSKSTIESNNTPSPVSNKEDTSATKENVSTEKKVYKCKVCGMITNFNTAYCIKCGSKFNE